MGIIRNGVCAALAVIAQPALAAVFIDRSPPSPTDAGRELVNQAEDKLFTLVDGSTSLEPQQNIMVKFTLASAMTLDGMDIFTRLYGNPNFATNLARPIGTPVTIKIRADEDGKPAATNLVRLLSTVSESSAVFPIVTALHMRVHADFAATALGPGTYWIGMSGTNINLPWNYTFDENAGINTYTLLRETVNWPLGVGNTASFRLHGFAPQVAPPPATIPEPASWAMLVSGFGLTGAVARRRRRLAA